MLQLASLRRAIAVLALAVGAAPSTAQEVSLAFGGLAGRAALSVTIGGRASLRAPARVWVPGRFERRVERVWVEGRERQVWVAARYETRRDACGRPYVALLRPGYWRTVRDPGRYEHRGVQVWVPGHWREFPRC